MDHINYLQRSIDQHQQVIQGLVPLFPMVVSIAERLRRCHAEGGKILLMGNGGSAADSQHIAAEIVGRFKKERKGLPAIALSTDTSILTSVGNDYGYEHIFARQVEALCQPQDVVIGISTSGNSKNVVRAIQVANSLGATTVGLLGGTGGILSDLCDYSLVMPSDDTPRIQEAHILLGHCLCEILEAD